MKYKPKNLKPVVLIVVVALVLIAAASYLGIVTTRSAIRIGYIGNGGWRSWSARYTMLDGSMKHTLRAKTSPGILHIAVVTESGSISIEIKDTDGNVVFSEDNIGTNTYSLDVPGKVVVRIKSDKHKGSFDITYSDK